MVKEPRSLTGLAAKLPAVSSAHISATKNTRRVYYKAACLFSDWCEGSGVRDLAQVKPPILATYVEWLGLPEPQGQGSLRPTLPQSFGFCEVRSPFGC